MYTLRYEDLLKLAIEVEGRGIEEDPDCNTSDNSLIILNRELMKLWKRRKSQQQSEWRAAANQPSD